MPTLSPEINTILFDLDGTLRTSKPSGEEIFLDFVAARHAKRYDHSPGRPGSGRTAIGHLRG